MNFTYPILITIIAVVILIFFILVAFTLSKKVSGGGGSIQVGTPADHDDVKRLVDIYMTGIGHKPMALSRDEFDQIAFRDWFTLVHRNDEGVIDGTITARPAHDSKPSFIRMVVIDPSTRGKGIGEALIKEALKRAPGAELYVEKTNPHHDRLIGYYTRLGFVIKAETIEGTRMVHQMSI